MIIIGDSPTLSCLGFLHLVRFEDLLSLQDLKPTKPVGHQNLEEPVEMNQKRC